LRVRIKINSSIRRLIFVKAQQHAERQAKIKVSFLRVRFRVPSSVQSFIARL